MRERKGRGRTYLYSDFYSLWWSSFWCLREWRQCLHWRCKRVMKHWILGLYEGKERLAQWGKQWLQGEDTLTFWHMTLHPPPLHSSPPFWNYFLISSSFPKFKKQTNLCHPLLEHSIHQPWDHVRALLHHDQTQEGSTMYPLTDLCLHSPMQWGWKQEWPTDWTGCNWLCGRFSLLEPFPFIAEGITRDFLGYLLVVEDAAVGIGLDEIRLKGGLGLTSVFVHWYQGVLGWLLRSAEVSSEMHVHWWNFLTGDVGLHAARTNDSRAYTEVESETVSRGGSKDDCHI